MKSIILIFLLIFTTTLYSQPDEYKTRGVKSFLVNYNAIQGKSFLSRFAARRFVLINEGSPTDRKQIHNENPSMPILFYKDIIGCHSDYPEFPIVNLEESAFLHSCEPSGITALIDNGKLYVYWLADRRGVNIIGYKLYTSDDSINFIPLNNIIIDTNNYQSSVTGSNWILVKSVMQDSSEIEYGFPVKIFMNKPDIRIWTDNIQDKRISGNASITINAKSVGKIMPDSVIITIDLNRDNALAKTENFIMTDNGGSYSYTNTLSYTGNHYGGYEFKITAYKNGVKYVFPDNGLWSTTLNNRTKSDVYDSYNMNICSSLWRSSYINQIQKAFINSGYNGLFEDDCDYVYPRWSGDVYPPYNYNDTVWKHTLFNFLDSIKASIAPRPVYFNGLYMADAECLIQHNDGGMSEGFGSSTWANLTFEPHWSELANLALKCQKQYNKIFQALGGIHNSDPESRIYDLASYLLIDNGLAMYGNADNYQEFAHYPEFDIPMGAPINSAALNINDLKLYTKDSIAYYERKFINGTVIVNPNSNKDIVIPGLKGKKFLMPDNLITVNGSKLYTIIATTDTIYREQARIFLEDIKQVDNYLASPNVGNISFSFNKDTSEGITVTISTVGTDSSSGNNMSDQSKPLYITVETGLIGGPAELVLKNDGTAASPLPSLYKGSFYLSPGYTGGTIDLPFTAYSTTGLVSVRKAQITLPGADSVNVLPNFSFEFDNDEDGVPDTWRTVNGGFLYDTTGNNAKTGRRSVLMVCDSAKSSKGIAATVKLNQTQPEDIVFSGWSKDENVTGSKNNDYCIYLDFYYNDGTPLYAQSVQFTPGTHDWEYLEKVVHPAKPVKSINIYCYFRNRTGKAWFDQLSLGRNTKTNISEVQYNSYRFDIFPNPSSNNITIAYQGADSLNAGISITNSIGIEVDHFNANELEGRNTINYSVEALPPGLYNCTYTNGINLMTKKFVVIR